VLFLLKQVLHWFIISQNATSKTERERERERVLLSQTLFPIPSLLSPAKMARSSTRIRFVDDDLQDIAFAKRGCCFNFSCFEDSSSKTTSSRRKLVREKKVKWWSKIREWSWKTFVRRFSNKNRAIGYRKQGSFHYDARSYAQNFDEGTKEKREEHYAYDFSSRYASVPSSAKSSMDLGKYGPSFIWLLGNVLMLRSRVSLFSTKTL